MSKQLFDSWHQWKVCFLSGCKNAGWGLWRIVSCFLFGIITIFVWCGKQIEAFCKRETTAAFIIGIVVVFLSIGWLMTFMSYSVKNKTLKHQRDSISIRYDMFMQTYENADTTNNY